MVSTQRFQLIVFLCFIEGRKNSHELNKGWLWRQVVGEGWFTRLPMSTHFEAGGRGPLLISFTSLKFSPGSRFGRNVRGPTPWS